MSPTSVRRSLVRSLALGAAIGVAGGVFSSGGCKPKTADTYNDELASAICKVRRNCPDIVLTAMTGDVVFPDDDTCEDAVVQQFDGCGTSCKYHAASASACLRRLDKIAGDCKDRKVGPCRRAYKKCKNATETSRCNIISCSSRVGAPSSEGLPWLAFATLGLVGLARRRRTRRG